MVEQGLVEAEDAAAQDVQRVMGEVLGEAAGEERREDRLDPVEGRRTGGAPLDEHSPAPRDGEP